MKVQDRPASGQGGLWAGAEVQSVLASGLQGALGSGYRRGGGVLLRVQVGQGGPRAGPGGGAVVPVGTTWQQGFLSLLPCSGEVREQPDTRTRSGHVVPLPKGVLSPGGGQQAAPLHKGSGECNPDPRARLLKPLRKGGAAEDLRAGFEDSVRKTQHVKALCCGSRTLKRFVGSTKSIREDLESQVLAWRRAWA